MHHYAYVSGATYAFGLALQVAGIWLAISGFKSQYRALVGSEATFWSDVWSGELKPVLC